ncbi:MAG: DMT family transporter [Flavobacteriales bacterium]|jgi:drug/metabolite transporter (DMT)-like permease|nr:DMT family transporter [Flavobacteriales bacterium]
MSLLTRNKDFILLHFIVLLFGFTGILGNLIPLSSFILVWARIGIAILGIGLYLYFSKTKIKIDLKLLPKLIFAGIIIAFHWITFFEAIKVSNVSVALATFSSSTLFTAILEPLYNKKRIVVYELLLGVIIIFAISLIFNIDLKYKQGILLSLISAFLASWFTVLNGKHIKVAPATVISFYELTTAFLILCFGLFFVPIDELFLLSSLQISYLLILGLVCTSFAFIASVAVMKSISAYTVTMTVNLEPIYSILLAIMIWPTSEKMPPLFYYSFAVILCCLFLNAYLKKKYSR